MATRMVDDNIKGPWRLPCTPHFPRSNGGDEARRDWDLLLPLLWLSRQHHHQYHQHRHHHHHHHDIIVNTHFKHHHQYHQLAASIVWQCVWIMRPFPKPSKTKIRAIEFRGNSTMPSGGGATITSTLPGLSVQGEGAEVSIAQTECDDLKEFWCTYVIFFSCAQILKVWFCNIANSVEHSINHHMTLGE